MMFAKAKEIQPQICEYFCEAEDFDDVKIVENKRKVYEDWDDDETRNINPVNTFKQIYNNYKPQITIDDIKIHYKESTIDPFTRLIQLKAELATISKDMTSYIENNKTNVLLSKAEHFDTIISELDQYKAKLDAFEKNKIYSTSKEKAVNSKDTKKEYTKLITDYTKATKDMFDKINQFKQAKPDDPNEVINENYDFIANIDLKQKVDIKEIETKLSSLEKTIGNWEMYKENKSIIDTLAETISIMKEENTAAFEKMKANQMDLIQKIVAFKETKTETFNNFMDIRDRYARYELYESFDEVFEYLKKRMKAIKMFHDESDKFQETANTLNDKIESNEKTLDTLGKNFTSTIDEFGKLELILKELNDIEAILKQKYMI